jgi:hypoxanthine phosphoribosyltransferase
VRLLKDTDVDISGRHVLIVEDIVDSGRTLAKICAMFSVRNPASLHVVTLLDKPERREVNVPVSFVGFHVPDRFVVGYGLDIAERYRHLDGIYTCAPDNGGLESEKAGQQVE